MVKKSKSDIKQRILEFITKKKRFVDVKEICEEFKISRPTATKYTRELLKEGWLEEEK